MRIQPENKFSVKFSWSNLTAPVLTGAGYWGCWLLGLLLILLACQSAAAATIFKDSQNNLYYFDQGKLVKSSNLGQNWLRYSTPLPASAIPLIFEAPSEKLLYLAWVEKGVLKLSYSRNAGLSFEKPLSPVSFPTPPNYVDIQAQKGLLQMLALLGEKIVYSRSADRGRTFSPLKTLNESLPAKGAPLWLTSQDQIEVFFASGKKIYRLISADQGASFTSPAEFYSTDKDIVQLFSSKDSWFWLEKTASGVSSLYSGNKQKLFETSLNLSSPEAQVTSLGADLITFWSAGERQYLIKNGANLPSYPKKLPAVPGLLIAENLPNQRPAAPVLSYPADNLKTNANQLKVALSANDPDGDPLSFTIELSWDSIFPADKTFTYLTASPEAEIPLTFPDGKYYLRAKASDGLSFSPFSPLLSFTLDREAPRIAILSPRPGAITNKGGLELSGTVTENCELTLNASPVTLSGLNFSRVAELNRGENRLIFKAKDGAGNASEEAIVVIYDENAPVLTIIRPGTGDWYKKKSTVLIEAAVDDKQGDIEDEKDANLYIDDILQKQPLIYNQADSRLSELLTLPDDLTHGVHKIKIEIADSAGNLGRIEGALSVDDSPPQVLEKSLLISKDKIVVPIAEEGSGLDAASSILKVTQASIEVKGTVKKENQVLIFYPAQPLLYGSYLLTVTPRDKIGNLGETRNIPVVFDAVQAQSTAVRTSDVKIETLEYGPNPFRPGRDGLAKIKYKLSGLAAAKLYIFSLEGNLILIKNLGNVEAGVTPWDGKNSFGEIVSSGLYPIALVATDSAGNREIKRGKLIVF